MTKGAFGKISDKYALPTGLGNVFMDCFAIAVLSLTGQNLHYAPELFHASFAAMRNATPKDTEAHRTNLEREEVLMIFRWIR